MPSPPSAVRPIASADRPDGRHHVVTTQCIDDQPVVGGLGSRDIHLGSQAEHGHAARIAGDGDHIIPVGAVDDDGVGRAVTHARARNAGQVEVELGDDRCRSGR